MMLNNYPVTEFSVCTVGVTWEITCPLTDNKLPELAENSTTIIWQFITSTTITFLPHIRVISYDSMI